MHRGIPTEITPQLNAFMTRMIAAFGTPDTANGAEFKRLLDARVGAYLEEVLLNTADYFIETRKSWPKIADVITVTAAQDAKHRAATNTQRKPRNYWADAENFARRWFEADADPDLIGRADIEGWRADLFNHAKCIAHTILIRGETPEFYQITMNEEDRDYYRNKARVYREAEVWREQHGRKFGAGKKGAGSTWLKANRKFEPSGEAIRHSLGLEPVTDEAQET